MGLFAAPKRLSNRFLYLVYFSLFYSVGLVINFLQSLSLVLIDLSRPTVIHGLRANLRLDTLTDFIGQWIFSNSVVLSMNLVYEVSGLSSVIHQLTSAMWFLNPLILSGLSCLIFLLIDLGTF